MRKFTLISGAIIVVLFLSVSYDLSPRRDQIMTELERLKFWLHLLEMEIEALRSVLSEFDGDKMEYLQMQKANAIDILKNSLVHP